MTTKGVLIGILLVAVFAVGLAIGRFFPTENVTIENKQPSTMQSNENQQSASSSGLTAESLMANMTEDQKKMLSALGIDLNTITPTMITCAETSLGANRIAEIKQGAALSFTEKAKIVACYK